MKEVHNEKDPGGQRSQPGQEEGRQAVVWQKIQRVEKKGKESRQHRHNEIRQWVGTTSMDHITDSHLYSIGSRHRKTQRVGSHRDMYQGGGRGTGHTAPA